MRGRDLLASGNLLHDLPGRLLHVGPNQLHPMRRGQVQRHRWSDELYRVPARVAPALVRRAGVPSLRARSFRLGPWAGKCDQCDAGRFSAAPARRPASTARPAGTRPRRGGTSARSAAGKFANGTRQTACENCRQFGEGRTSAAGAAVCEMCEADYYYDGGECIKCPWSATCPANSTLGSPWVVDEGFYRFSMDTPAIYRCKRNDGCVGGPGAGDAMCADHHRGPLCQLCDEGYYMEHVLRTCLKCDRRPSVFLTVAFGMMMLVAIGLVVHRPGSRALAVYVGRVRVARNSQRGCGDDWRLVRLWRWLKVHCGDFSRVAAFWASGTRWRSFCVEINQCGAPDNSPLSFLDDDAAVLAPSSGEEPASPRHRADVAGRRGRRGDSGRARVNGFPHGSWCGFRV